VSASLPVKGFCVQILVFGVFVGTAKNTTADDKLLRVIFAPDYEQVQLKVLFYSIGDELHAQLKLAIDHFSTRRQT